MEKYERGTLRHKNKWSKKLWRFASVLISKGLLSHFQVADGGRVGVALQHDLYVLHSLFSCWPRTCDLISHFLRRLLQL